MSYESMLLKLLIRSLRALVIKLIRSDNEVELFSGSDSLKIDILLTTCFMRRALFLYRRISTSLIFVYSSFLNLFLHIFLEREVKRRDIIEKSVPKSSSPL